MNKTKRSYSKPVLKQIKIDKDVSLMMLSTPPGGGGGGDPEWRKANPKAATNEPQEKDLGPFRTD